MEFAGQFISISIFGCKPCESLYLSGTVCFDTIISDTPEQFIIRFQFIEGFCHTHLGTHDFTNNRLHCRVGQRYMSFLIERGQIVPTRTDVGTIKHYASNGYMWSRELPAIECVMQLSPLSNASAYERALIPGPSSNLDDVLIARTLPALLNDYSSLDVATNENLPVLGMAWVEVVEGGD